MQGHQACALWVVEEGVIVAMQHSDEHGRMLDAEGKSGPVAEHEEPDKPAHVRLVHVPCLLAESVFLFDTMKMARQHQWT